MAVWNKNQGGLNIGKAKLTQEELKRRTQERNRKYWEAHREEIALKRKAKREQAKAEKQAREKLYQEQAEAFLNDIEADTDIQNALRDILGGKNPRNVVAEYAMRKAETERALIENPPFILPTQNPVKYPCDR